MAQNKWLVFANENKCKHLESLLAIKKIRWVMGRQYHFKSDDVVFLFMSNECCLRFKTVVTEENGKRSDSPLWVEKTPNDMIYRLELVKEYDGNNLFESHLVKHSFKGGRSFLHLMKGNKELLEYIDSEFEKY